MGQGAFLKACSVAQRLRAAWHAANRARKDASCARHAARQVLLCRLVHLCCVLDSLTHQRDSILVLEFVVSKARTGKDSDLKRKN